MSVFGHNIQFQRLLSSQEGVDIVSVMLELAGDVYGDLNPQETVDELDRLGDLAKTAAGGFARERTEVRAAFARIAEMLREQGFHGNEEDYYDPRNSYLHEVLARRLGIPISLGIVLVAVAHRARLPVYGVAAPGHFVVGCDAGGAAYYVDLFNGPEVLTRTQCRKQIAQRTGIQDIPESAFRPASVREIVVRVLRNLKNAYARRDEWSQALPVQRRLSLLLPGEAEEQRDLGLLLLRNSQPWAALDCFEGYLEQRPAEARQLRPFVQTARKLGAEMN